MSDYISRADAIADLEELAERYNGTVTADGVDLAIDRIKALPSADAVQEAVPTVVRVTMSDGSQYYLEHERDAIQSDAVQGEWIKKQVFNPELDKYVPFIECSVCGYEPYYGGSESKFNYCSNCGAKMVQGGDDE